MSAITFGLLCGLGFGIIDVLVMIPLKYETSRKKKEAMVAAFAERFMIGFLIPNVSLGISPILIGAILGLTLSLPSAIISRAYGPIIATGIVGGVAVGFAVRFFLV